MVLIKGVKSKTKPVEIDDFSSETTVYVRENIIETTEIDPVFYEENTIYIYDEKQYSWREWFNLNMESVRKELNDIRKLNDETKNTLSEIMEILTKSNA